MANRKIKFFLLSILFLFLSNTCISQAENNSVPARFKELVKEVSDIIKNNSLYTDSLDWNQIYKESALLHLGDNDSVNREIIFDFFTKKLRGAGDMHSFFLSKKSLSLFEKHPNKNYTDEPKGKYLGNGIGMIIVPGCLLFDKSAYRDFANEIRRQIKEIDIHHNIKGWIVDLRNNSGGNMWPMLAGLNALTEDGIVGYFVSNEGQIPWRIRNGHLYYPNSSKINHYKIKNFNSKIAVLIDSTTASSGEATAISFIGLPNVKLFGQPSGGYTTANYTYTLSDGSIFNLAKLHDADRNHKAYLGKIIPDVLIKNVDGTFDTILKTAEKWILESE